LTSPSDALAFWRVIQRESVPAASAQGEYRLDRGQVHLETSLRESSGPVSRLCFHRGIGPGPQIALDELKEIWTRRTILILSSPNAQLLPRLTVLPGTVDPSFGNSRQISEYRNSGLQRRVGTAESAPSEKLRRRHHSDNWPVEYSRPRQGRAPLRPRRVNRD